MISYFYAKAHDQAHVIGRRKDTCLRCPINASILNPIFDISGKPVEAIDMSKYHGFLDTFPRHVQAMDTSPESDITPHNPEHKHITSHFIQNITSLIANPPHIFPPIQNPNSKI